MKVVKSYSAKPAMDGDGVNIRRVADFVTTRFDPFLMIDEIQSDNEQDFIGGFPAHPHRGIETFTYIRKGGFEHRDQLGNVKAIRAGDAQWMSTGFGVVHSEMPLADAKDGLHGFQIWVNMPAKDKLRPAIYHDTASSPKVAESNGAGATLTALAGNWAFVGRPMLSAPLQGLSGQAALADLSLAPMGTAQFDLSQHEFAAVYVYQGELRSGDIEPAAAISRAVETDAVAAGAIAADTIAADTIAVDAIAYRAVDRQVVDNRAVDKAGHQAPRVFHQGELLVLDSQVPLHLMADQQGAGMLLFVGKPIREAIVQMGPFVMNTHEEIQQAIRDYQAGRFGELS
ncbi:MAG: pirin family protein [Shewanella sp.]